VKLLDETLVIYRTTNGVHCAKDLCLHRGAPLSMGWVEGEELVCGFHGFRYDRTGACVRVPAHPGVKISSKLCLHLYPTVERYGLIWTCLGGEAIAPLPDWPEIEGKGGYEIIYPPAVNWKASAGRQVENFNDVAHLSWVHHATFGCREQPEIPVYPVIETEHRLTFEIPEAPWLTHDPEGKKPDEVITVRYVYDCDLLFATKLLVDYRDGRHQIYFNIACPVSAQECRIFDIMARNDTFGYTADQFIEYQLLILTEDQPFVEKQCPEKLPLDLREEVHIHADRLSVAYRKRLVALGLGESFTA
jgi:vanillate O-demethylase monooxygenase subunit